MNGGSPSKNEIHLRAGRFASWNRNIFLQIAVEK